MLLVLDRDGDLGVYDSLVAAEAHLETIDIENHEYEFCDETGQPYAGEVLQPTSAFNGGDFRLVPGGAPDSTLPLSFVIRAKSFSSEVHFFRTLEDARSYFSRAKSMGVCE